MKEKGRFRRVIGWLVGALPWLLLAPVLVYLLLFDGWEDVTRGRLERMARDVFHGTGRVTKAELYLIQSENDATPDAVFPSPYGGLFPAFQKVELTGADLEWFLELWRGQALLPGVSSVCHTPAYGVRLYRGDMKVTETAVCWECSNFSFEVYPGLAGTYSFDAELPIGRSLLRFCDRKLPVLEKEIHERLELADFPKKFTTPVVTEETPGPGRRVRQWLPGYEGTGVFHALYLPTDWERGKTYPVIFEYSGNQYRGSKGTVDECDLGYGITGGVGHILVSLPYVAEDGISNQGQWWGDLDKTVEYCKKAVPAVCEAFGGNPDMVFLAGFSRGAIACNFVGLHDDEIARLWCGFICHSHYDGVREWNYPGSDRESALKRLSRLKGRPQYITHELSVKRVDDYLWEANPRGDFSIVPLPFPEHTDEWVLYDHPWRNDLRSWLISIWMGIQFEQEDL